MRISAPFAPRRGFTLLEMLVALGAVALISIGLARIFGATGDTLRAGRRLSLFNDASRAIERTLREDFSRMTRDGFLVISHELTERNIARFPNDRNARKRRVDQIMFFQHGRFQTHRTPLYPGRIATGSQARIWIGHGLRQEPGTPRISVPALDDINRDGGTSASGARQDTAPWFGEAGPNRYASDWILARHIAVLAQPKTTPPPRPSSLLFPTMDQWPDRDIQIDLAPAVSSLFRNLARGTPDMLPSGAQIARPGEASVARPQLSSGIPDVVSTDLSEIRSIVLDAQAIDTSNRGREFDPALDNNTDVYERREPDGRVIEVTVPYAFQPDTTADGSRACFAMKQWMLQGLPAEPRTQTRRYAPDPPNPQPTDSPQFGGRMRCEPLPPDLLGTLANNGQVYIQDQEYRRADQAMLASSVFATACTEFIVEWSFGETYKSDTDPSTPGDTPDPFLNGAGDPRADQLIWHGLPRFSELDFVDGTDPQADRIAGPYFGKRGTNMPVGVPANVPIDEHRVPVLLTNRQYEPGDWPVAPQVIHEPVDDRGRPDPIDGEPFYSIFGYVDPSFPGPINPANVVTAADQLRLYRPDTIPCPWPRLIRITMTLADPADPTFEQTYQFIFEVPAASQTDNAG